MIKQSLSYFIKKICHQKFLDIIVIVKEWYFWLFFSLTLIIVCRSDPPQRVNLTLECMRKVFTVSFHGFETVKQNREKIFYAIIFFPEFFQTT